MVLYRTSRDVFEMFRALAPLRVRTSSRDAMLFRNDCEYLGRALTVLAHLNMAAFPEDMRSTICTVDLAPGFFDMGDVAQVKEVATRCDEIANLCVDGLKRQNGMLVGFVKVVERLDAVGGDWANVLPSPKSTPYQELLDSLEIGLISAMTKVEPLSSRQQTRDAHGKLSRLSQALLQRGGSGINLLVSCFEPHVSLPLFVNDFASNWKPTQALGVARFLFQNESSEEEMKQMERMLLGTGQKD